MPQLNTQKLKKTLILSLVFVFILPVFNSYVFAGGKKISVTITKKSYNGSDVSCYQAADAQLTITASDGNGTYFYSIDNGVTFYNNNVFSNLAGGQNYTVIVKDSDGNKSDAKKIWISNVSNPVTISSINAVNTTCPTSSDGAINLTAFGGTQNTIWYSIDNGATWQTASSFNNLKAGNYTIIAKDINGCTSDSKSITVSSGSPLNAVIYYQEDYNCKWGVGKVQMGAQNGKSPYQYSLDGQPFVTNNTFSNLAPGGHNVSVIDTKGCSASISFEIKAALNVVLSGDTTIHQGKTAILYLNISDDGSQNNTYSAVLNGNDGSTLKVQNLLSGMNTINTPALSQSVNYTISGVTSSTGCKPYIQGSASISVTDKLVWLGLTNDWNDAKNWKGKIIPDSSWDVSISSTQNNPEIASTSYAENISISSPAILTITGNLFLDGNITGGDSSIDAGNGTIIFGDTIGQELDGSVFKNRAIKNMVINTDLTLTDSLDVYGNINFQKNGKTFYTNDLLTLKSNSSGTANVGNTSRNIIAGKVTVENYIAPRKGWKFLSVSTLPGQSIHDAWQEGQPANNTTSILGKGIQITGEMSDWQAKGFDAPSYAPSVKTYNSKNNTWVGIKSTLDSFKDSSDAYMVFIRGDRTANVLSSPVTETTLRTRGELRLGDQPTINITPGQFIAIGNPYASKIDPRKILTTRNMFYYYWDPQLGNSYGAYRTIKIGKNGKMKVIPSISNNKDEVTYINSGEAFFAFNEKGGSLQITENSKVDSVNPGSFLRPAGARGALNDDDELEINLFNVSNGQEKLVDGVLQDFNADYSNSLDENDAVKSANTGENLSIKSQNTVLAMESKSLSSGSDTTQLNFTGMSYANYRFKINLTEQANDREAFLVDRFTGKSTPIDLGGTTTYDFTIVNNSGSYAANRFLVVFRKMTIMPVTFTSVTAEKKDNKINVIWKIENEENVNNYSIERSSDGTHFNAIGSVNADHSTQYQFTDDKPLSGVNFYRIVSVDLDGKKGYSEIAKATIDQIDVKSMSIFPNPVVGNNVHLQMKTSVNGVYYFSIRNQAGQTIDSRQVNVNIGQSSMDIKPTIKLASGIYTLEITYPTGEQSTLRFVK